MDADPPHGPTTVLDGAGNERGPSADQEPVEVVVVPGALLRVAGVIRRMLEEVRTAPLDEAGRARMLALSQTSVAELHQCLDPALYSELQRLLAGPDEPIGASEGELRINNAVLVGWLEGLMDGLQAAWSVRQIAAQQDPRPRLDGRRPVPGQMTGDRRDASLGQYL